MRYSSRIAREKAIQLCNQILASIQNVEHMARQIEQEREMAEERRALEEFEYDEQYRDVFSGQKRRPALRGIAF